MKNRRIIVNSNCYHGYPVQRALESIHRLGLRNVELTATKGWTEHVFPSMSFSELLSVRNLIQSLDLSVPAMSGHVSLMDDERIGDFLDNIELAAFFGAHIIVSSVGEAHIRGREADDDVLVRNIESIIPALERNSMTLVLETHGEHGTGRRLLQITDRIRSERVGICYDTANVVFYGGVKGSDDLEACQQAVRYIHIKDKAGEEKEWNFPALGKGYIDFPALLKVLDDNDNSSPLSIEIEFTSSGSSSIEEVDKAVADSRDYLLSLGYTL